MNIVIIEDEKLTAKDLAKTLQAIGPEIKIIGMLHSLEAAVDFFSTRPSVDLIFSDIELGDGLSFELFGKMPITTPVIFCTAYDHYALDAFGTVGIDYVLKPFSKERIEKTLRKYQTLKEKFAAPKQDFSDLLQLLKQKAVPRSRSVIIHQGEKIIPLPETEIALFYIEKDYTFAYTFMGKKHILSQNMDHLEKTFVPEFFRANRQFLVNRKAVKDASQHFNRKLRINLTIAFPEPIMVGKLKMTAFTNWLAGEG